MHPRYKLFLCEECIETLCLNAFQDTSGIFNNLIEFLFNCKKYMNSFLLFFASEKNERREYSMSYLTFQTALWLSLNMLSQLSGRSRGYTRTGQKEQPRTCLTLFLPYRLDGTILTFLHPPFSSLFYSLV